MNPLSHYFPNLTSKQLEQFEQFEQLFLDWNSKINLVSRKDTQNITTNHMLHSLAIGKLTAFSKGSSVLDIGTGGGFPGLPLAILFPETSFHLVDSIGKKIMVVKEIASEIGLSNVTADHIRAQEVKQKFEYIVSRAVTRLNRFLPWIEGKFSKEEAAEPSGLLYLKGGDLSEELSEIGNTKYQLFKISNFFDEKFFETKQIVHISRSALMK